MEFNQIHYFIEVCSHNSLTKAAEALYITPQALSKTIISLENELKCSLFIRSVKGITLTPEGKLLYDRFQPIVRAFYKTVRQTAVDISELPQSLPLCCSPGVMRGIPPEHILSFREKYKNIDIEIIELPDVDCVDYIRADRRRFGLMMAPLWKLEQEKLQHIVVKTEPAYLLVHRDNLLASLKSVSLRQLKNQNILMLGKKSFYQEALNEALKDYNFSVEPYFESSDFGQIFRLVNLGHGIFLTAHDPLRQTMYSNIALIQIEERSFDFCISFNFNDYDYLDQIQKLFIDWIVEKNKVEI